MLFTIYFKSKGFGCQILEARIKEANGPASSELAKTAVTIRKAILLTCHLHLLLCVGEKEKEHLKYTLYTYRILF